MSRFVTLICEQCHIPFDVRPYRVREGAKYCSPACGHAANIKERIPCNCQFCGTTIFVLQSAIDNGRAYCSVGCRGKAISQKIEHACAYCGTIFLGRATEERKYCSRNCFEKGHVETMRQYHANQPSRRIECTCEICGISYSVTQAQYRDHPSRCCSRECLNAWKRTIRGETHPLKKPEAHCICEHCGKEYTTKPALAPRSRFCSKQCHGAWTKLHFPNNPTGIEIKVAQLLKDMDILYLQEHHIGRYICDFVLPEHRVIVECDGTYWHRAIETQAKDMTKDLWLAAHGWRVVRLPETKINTDLRWCKKQILKAIR